MYEESEIKKEFGYCVMCYKNTLVVKDTHFCQICFLKRKKDIHRKPSIKKTPKLGYDRSSIKHINKEFARGNVHTNTIEGFWSQLKRSISGTYHSVSKKYLQSYVNEFAFRYNQRSSEQPTFGAMVERI